MLETARGAAFFLNKLSRANEIFALCFIHQTMKSRRTLLRLAWEGFKEADFASFNHLSTLLNTAIKPAQQTVEALSFSAFHVSHRIDSPNLFIKDGRFLPNRALSVKWLRAHKRWGR